MEEFLYTIGSVIIVSLISLIGVFTLAINPKRLHKYLHILVSFAAGALLGDAFIHLIPQAVEEGGFTLQLSAILLAAIIFGFIVEKFLRWRHSHEPVSDEHPHPIAMMNLIGDALHNFIDGIIIGASYLISIPTGIATTVAVILHEIPQEIGDFGVLLHSGLSRRKALLYNFLSALTSVAGALIVLYLGSTVEHIELIAAPFAAGLFIYIAGSDLIPELHKHEDYSISVVELFALLLGMGIMAALLLVE